MKKYFIFFLKLIKSLLLRPITTFEWVIEDFKKDLNAKKYKSPHKLVWCAGLPKSGTTLIEEIFDNLPYVRLNNSFNRLFNPGVLDHDHGISDQMFKNLSNEKFSFFKTHTHYEKKYEKIAINYNLKIIISLRDLRDMLISRYFHILADKKHWLHKSIKDLNFTDGFIASLSARENKNSIDSLNYYYNWVSNWLDISKEKKYLVLWYEDYKQNPINYIKKILDYTSFDEFSPSEINNKILIKKNKLPLSKNLKIHGRLRSTFRKGVVGEWKELFNNKISDYFYKNIPQNIEKIEHKYNT